MKFSHHRRAATVLAGSAVCALASIAVLGPLAGLASAATSPSITVTFPAYSAPTVAGSGFTPGGKVFAEVESGTTVVFSADVVASEPVSTWVCVTGLKPSCHEVTIPGGQFTVPLSLPVLGCGALETATVKATDLTTGLTASEPIEWAGMC
jgi:hypothetical protein